MLLDKVNHAEPKEKTEPKTIEQIQSETEEAEAQVEADAIFVSNKQGHLDHGFNEMLRQSFFKDTKTGAVNWKATLELRKKLAKEYEWRRELGRT